MEKLCNTIVKLLKENKKTIAFMESCTGGFLANQITNISGASDVLKVSAVTYSNEYKIKFGVSKEVIDTYTVYSQETAIEMAKKIAEFANSSMGVGITGELGNTINSKPKVYYSIYIADQDKYINKTIVVTETKRAELKKEVAQQVFADILRLVD